VTLYGYWRSSSTWRVRIGLALKGLDYTNEPVNLLHSAQLDDAHRARNPMGQVPALVDGDIVLTQSLPILEYLEECYPETSLLPGSPAQRAAIRAMAEGVNSGIPPLQNLAVLKHLDTHDVDRGDWSRHWMDAGLRALESMVTGPGPFLLTDGPTLAEACLIPQLYNARRFKMDVTAYPRLAACEAACLDLPAFQQSHPDQQSDAVL
jgi:maleylacetoacetate isomerase